MLGSPSNRDGYRGALAVAIALLTLLSTGPALAEKRIALVVAIPPIKTSLASTIPGTMRH
jgi:hypothetical protein